mgnify:CR=1 FL=1
MKGHEHHVFENQIFDHWRKNQKKIKEAIKLLKENGYIIYTKEKV